MIHYTLSNTRLLPIEYLEVAYIESTGTLYIDTGIKPTFNTTTYIKFLTTTDLPLDTNLFGATNGDFKYALYIGDGGTNFKCYNNFSSGTSYFAIVTENRELNEFLFNDFSHNVIWNNVLKTTITNPNNLSSSVNMWIFRRNGIEATTAKFKCYSFIIWESGVLKRHFVPCYRKSDNKPGLFDIVEKKFYINSGSGEFILGDSVNQIYEMDVTDEGGDDITEGKYLTIGLGLLYVSCSSSVSGNERSVTINSLSSGSTHGFYMSLASIPQNSGKYTFKVTLKASRAITVSIGHERGGTFNANLTTSYLTFTKTWTTGTQNNQACIFYASSYLVGDVITIKDLSITRSSTPYLGYSNTLIITNVGQSYGIEGQYDKNIYSESDGSKWIRIFHHNNPANARFESTDTFTTGVYKDANRWFDVAKCNEVNKWELMIKQKTTSDAATSTYRFILYVNPMSATLWDLVKPGTVKNISGGTLGGIWRMNNNAYLVTANSASTNWFGAIGAWNSHQGGIHGYPNTVITSGFMDLYLRVDNVCPMYKDCYEFNETGYCEIPSGVFKCFDNDVFTISFWIKDEDANRSIYFGNYSAAPNFNIEKKGDRNLRYYQVRNDGTKDIALFAIPKSKWTLVTLTVNSGTLKAYKNGILSSTTSIGTKHSSSYANTIFRIGSDTRSDTTRFKGYMLDFRVYDYALTDNEILKLYNMRNV